MLTTSAVNLRPLSFPASLSHLHQYSLRVRRKVKERGGIKFSKDLQKKETMKDETKEGRGKAASKLECLSVPHMLNNLFTMQN